MQPLTQDARLAAELAVADAVHRALEMGVTQRTITALVEAAYHIAGVKGGK